MARYQALGGVELTLGALQHLSVELRTSLRGLVRTATERTRARAAAGAPVARVGGGATRQAISKTYFDDGDTGSVFVAPTRDWRTGRVRAKNLPIWQEYGTRRAAEHPYLTPAGREEGRRMVDASLRLVANAVAKAEV
jgi:hypothetical protein